MPNTLQVRIRKFIESISQLKETIHDPKIEFGFRFLYPNEKGRTIIIIKQKKKNLIEIQSSTSISPEHLQKLNKEKQKTVFSLLGKVFIAKGIHHKIDTKNKRYTILCHLYYEDETEITVDKIYTYIRGIFFIDLYAVGIIQEFVSGKFKSEDIGPKFNIYS